MIVEMKYSLEDIEDKVESIFKKRRQKSNKKRKENEQGKTQK
jgi:hypothetical protein